MEAVESAELFVEEEIPSAIRPLIPAALRRAYALADETIERLPYLQSAGGKYQRGDLIMLAASYELEQLVKAGSLPFEGAWEYFARPTGKHYVLRSRRALITTSQVEKPRKKPRHAVHRANFAELNEWSLFEEDNEARRLEREAIERDGTRRLVHILHGYQDLSFAHLAYPHPEKNRHIYRSPNLMTRPHVVSDLPPAEGPAASPDPQALENLERHLRDND